MSRISYIAFCSLAGLILWQCGADHGPELRQLTSAEIVERARTGIPPSPYVVFKDSAGNPLDGAGREKLNAGLWAADPYVNETGEVVEMIARPATLQDEILAILVDAAFRSTPVFVPEPVDCENQSAVLAELLAADRATPRTIRRTDLNRIYDTDRENQNTLANLIEQCGFPAKERVGAAGMEAVFEVFSHAETPFLAAHFPALQKSAEKGDLPPGRLAELTDYLLSLNSRPQVYGTQVRFNPATGKNELYLLRDRERVDERRAAVGLEPIAVFLDSLAVERDF